MASRVFRSITIDRPIDDVFATLTNVENTEKWFPVDVKEWWTSEAPRGVGSTRRAAVRIGWFRNENDARELDRVLDREGLIYLVLVSQVGIALEVADERLGGTALERLVVSRDLLLARVDEIHAFEAAREQVEARYLDGASAIVPAARRAWDRQRHESEEAAVMALRLAELDGADSLPSPDQVAFDDRVASLASDFVEPAKVKAYDELGDGRRAQAIAAAWLRAG